MKQFAIVTAVYNVARYLPEFIASIEGQDVGLEHVQVVAVDDGSTDCSLEVLREWETRQPGLVTVLAKENGGQGSARNLGIDAVDAEWVTYIDPDDVIDSDYLRRVSQFAESHPDVPMIATNRIVWEERNGQYRPHPLAAMFEGGDQLVDLLRFPEYFHGSAPSAFFRTQVIKNNALRYDDRVQPNFEDGHFCVRYLFRTSQTIGFVASAKYRYRKRADSSSTLQNSLLDPRKFTDVPRFGYLDALETAASLYGKVPEWLQNFIIYEMSFYFTAEMAASGSHSVATGRAGSDFLDLAKQIRAHLDRHVIEAFAIRRIPSAVRDYINYGLADEDWCTDYAVLERYDHQRKLVRATYRYIGSPPSETFLYRGDEVAPIASKRRAIEFFGKTVAVERIAWLHANGTFEIRLNGTPARLATSWPGHKTTRLRPTALRERVAGKSKPRFAWLRALHPSLNRRAQSGRVGRRGKRHGSRKRRAHLREDPISALRFRNAWVLMDRIHDADDSGERLFRHLREHRPDINAWFVLERDVPDWDRLVADGYGPRLVSYGSRRWKQLLINAEHLISSHADAPIQNPPGLPHGQRRWKFTFLQHGVIKDDLSDWLNDKEIDLFVTSTTDEYASIVADGSRYAFTSHEVKLTGLPRFDRQLAVGGLVSEGQRDLLLVAPTWRHWLSPPIPKDSQRREVHSDFLTTAYVRNWLQFLKSEELARVCADEGLTIGFLPHPNIQPALNEFDLPAHVRPMTFHGEDVQRLFARAALMVTDYSSMAFNAAYIDRPVVYFQFDQDRMFGGGHVGRSGYFQYERHGFGPVVTSVNDAVAAVRESLEAGRRSPISKYQERIDAAFPLRDGRCCQRVVDAIENLSR